MHGVPSDPDETKSMLLEIIRDIGNFYQVKIEQNNLDEYHRLPSRARDVIIVKFANRWVMSDWLEKKFGTKLTANDIGFDNRTSRIFVNVSLTKERGQLASATRKFCQVNNVSHSWMIKDGYGCKRNTPQRKKAASSLNTSLRLQQKTSQKISLVN